MQKHSEEQQTSLWDVTRKCEGINEDIFGNLLQDRYEWNKNDNRIPILFE